MATRMARYDVRNDGAGPYATFYCDTCSREYRSQPDVQATITNEVGRDILGGFLRRNVPILGNAVARGVDNQDPRYVRTLNPQQLESAWNQIKDVFHECPTCHQLVCNSDWDSQAGTCSTDSPRREEIAQAQAEQAAGVAKGIANAFGFGAAIKNATQAAKRAADGAARCPNDGTMAKPGTKFCPECGAAMIQPTVAMCPSCGTPSGGAKFCPECGTQIEQAQPAAVLCAKCGADTNGAKFCPECGNKMV
ncbi:MAG: double zinc ribbon domain-containing protein [Chloroflexota bacterium]